MADATVAHAAGSVQVKTCARCKTEKPATREAFGQLKKAKGGLHSWCKRCCAEDRRAKRAANPEHYAKIEKDRYERHGDRRRAANREIWARNSEKYREVASKRFSEKKDGYNAARRQAFAESLARREARAKQGKEWREANAEALKANRRAKWEQASLQQRLRMTIGAAISRALKRGGKGGRSWQVLVDYKVDDLKRHIERQFTKGMTWENYGQWHIDHIIPASSFIICGADDPELKACWALANLRPLWAADNIRKRDNRVYLI